MRQPSVPRPGNLRRDDVGAVLDVGTGRAVTVCGELDAASAPALSAALALLIDDDGEIYVEISAVGFIDADGLNALCAASQALGERGRIVAANPSPKVRRVFNIAQLERLVGDTADDATAISEAS